MAESITSFRGPYAFLSNFHRMPDGSTLEHHYQAAKATGQQDAGWVMEAPTPALAKKRGRTITKRDDWDLVRNDVMLRLLRTKFEREPYSTLLLETGDAMLIEGNTWHDQYWGNCTCPMHVVVEGQNWLGKLLMQVREELRDGPKAGLSEL